MKGEMFLPRPVATTGDGVVLRVVDYTGDERQAKASGSTLVIDFDQVHAGYVWRVERIVVTPTSAALLTCGVYIGYASPPNLRDWTQIPAGWVGVAEYPMMLNVPAGRNLSLVLTGCNAGDEVTTSIQYQLVQRPGGA